MAAAQKIENLDVLLNKTLLNASGNTDEWLSLLSFASRFYKYPFEDQVLIFAQRPNAKACASYDIWNKRMHRSIRRGSRGIPLIDRSNGEPRLNYVYDIDDTHEASPASLSPTPWKINEGNRETVLSGLQKAYGYFGDTLDDQISGMAVKIVNDFYINKSGNPEHFESITSSLCYALFSRCGLDVTGLRDKSAYSDLSLVEKSGEMLKIGTFITRSAKIILRKVEDILKNDIVERSGEHGKEEHSRGNGRNIRQDRRELLSEPGFGRRSGTAGGRDTGRTGTAGEMAGGRRTETIHGQIRLDEGRLFEKPPARYVQRNAGERNLTRTPVEYTSTGDRPAGINDGSTEQDQPAAGQSIRSLGMGSAYEHAEGERGGNHPQRTDLRINEIGETSAVGNYRITDEHLGETGAKTRYKNNIAALHTLRELEREDRPATLEEQNTLALYTGWGGIPQVFDEHNNGWNKEHGELKTLLTGNDYEMARASTLNAHYTSPVVINEIYRALERMGFHSGNILEPACGVGNFFGMLPESMKDAKLHGVELDNVTGRIARKLYPDADIAIQGFEDTLYNDNYFDLAVGNVPFGNYGVSDSRYIKHSFMIHDYFFAKSLDKVRPGGVIAFVTSKGTLDKKNPRIRKYLAQRAELLGAVRLPNNAFLANARTEVTTDIIFLQKREHPIEIEPDWVHLSHDANGIPVNAYFTEHPEMVLGTMVFDKSMYGDRSDTACVPFDNVDLKTILNQSLQHINSTVAPAVNNQEPPPIEDAAALPAYPGVRNYSYTVVNNSVYFRENAVMNKVEKPDIAINRIKAMVELRDCVRELIDCQLNDYSDAVIEDLQIELNRRYDAFIAKYGLINSRGNSMAFSEDSGYYLLCSLEILNEDGTLLRKSDIFNKRTIKKKVVIDHVDTASEALAISIAERACVDIPFMAGLTGITENDVIEHLAGIIFPNPERSGQDNRYVYETADQYLSGNVREKLRIAREQAKSKPELTINVSALEAVQPKDLTAGEIDIRLGSTWVDKRYIQEFVHDLLKPPFYVTNTVTVDYDPYTSEWVVSGKNFDRSDNVLANVTYGTARMNAYRLIEEALNLKEARVYDVISDGGSEKRVLNRKETMLAQQKQDDIKRAFRDWIFKDPDRRENLVKTYNERFNSVRPREYDGSHIEFAGINPEIKLFPHQVNAIAHVLYGGNTLLAHEVGAGKSFEMIASAMESKRLGLCNKSLFVVPNHIIEQMASDFMRLYPSANILVATKKDFEPQNRKKFCARIATGDYDAVIIGHSQFEKIPMSKERQERTLHQQIDEITEGISEAKKITRTSFTIKQLEKSKKQLETKLRNLLNDDKKDDVVTFEELGIDRLFVDEAHNYKNLFLYTKMRNVAGISQTEAQKS